MDQNEQKYLESQICKQNFIDVLNKLSAGQMSLLCTQQGFSQAYDHILKMNGKVLGKDLYDFAVCLQQKYTQCIAKDLQYYRITITQFLLKGVQNIKMQQFGILFKNTEEKTKLTEKLQQRLKGHSIISLKKLMKVIKQAEQKCIQANPLSNVLGNDIHIQKSSIYYGEQTQKNPLKNLEYLCNEYVKDSLILEKINQLIQQLQSKLQNLKEDFNSSEQQNRKLLGQINRYQVELQQKDDIINQQAQKISKIRVNFFEEQNQNETLMRMIRQIQSQLSVLKQQNKVLDQSIVILQEKLANPEKEKKEKSQVQQTVQSVETEEKEDKIFAQRTLREKLEDANFKINRLTQQKRKLQSSMEDLKLASQIRINNLQQQLQQLEKRIYRDTMIKNLRFSGIKSTIGQKFRSSYLQASDINSSKIVLNNATYEVATSVFKKFTDSKRVVEGADELLASCIHQYSYQQQNLTYYDFIGFSNEKQFHYLAFHSKLSKQYNISNGIFSTIGHIIKQNGDFYDIFLVLTSAKLYILDTKYKQKQSYLLNDVMKIIICHHNCNMLILKFKVPFSANKNKTYSQTQTTKILSLFLHSRKQFLQYLENKSCECFTSEKISILPQENIQITIGNKNTTLSKYEHIFNPFHLALGQAQSVFQVSVQQKGYVSIQYLAYEAILIIQPIGLLFFFKQGPKQIINKQKLLYWLPLVKQMRIYERNEKKINIEYLHYKKQFRIHTLSSNLTKKIIEDCKKMLDCNSKNKEIQQLSWNKRLKYKKYR